jgi:hypothetical protein
VNERFVPRWMWIGVIAAVVIGIGAAVWLFGALGTQG